MKKRILRSESVVILLSVISLIIYLLPFAKYSYQGIVYNLNGTDFLFGRLIAGGSVYVAPSALAWVDAIALVLGIVLVVCNMKLSVKVLDWMNVALACIAIFGQLVLMKGVEDALNGVKNPGTSIGGWVMLVAEILLVAAVLWKLYREKRISTLHIMIIPGALYLLINNYVPMVGIFLAFKKIDYSKGIWASDWVGLENFKNLFYSAGGFFKSDAFIMTRNTLLYNAAFIVLGIVTGIAVGILLAEIASKLWQKIFQTTILLPQLISMVVVSYIVFAFLSSENGLITKNFFDEGEVVNLYGIKWIWSFILTFVQNWKMLGYNAVIFLASIVGIDRSLYEAAKVDGASKWEQITKITLPMLKPTVITLFLLQVGRIFYSDFGLFYQVPLNTGTLYSVTQTVDTYVYRSLLVSNNISTSAAASAYQAVVGFVLVVVVNLIVRKVDKENALF